MIMNSKAFSAFDYNKQLFYFLFNLKNKAEKFKININTSCLVLSPYPGAEIKGLGGLIAQYPKNFEVLCLTNGSSLLPQYDAIESASVKKQQFHEVSRLTRIKGSKIFDIEDKTLKNHFSTFRKIDISEADYIFLPNVYNSNPDAISLLSHFKKLLEDKEYKKNLKLVMYEADNPLCCCDLYVNISSIIETKKKMLSVYYPEDKYRPLIQKTVGLNSYRAMNYDCDYVESFMSIGIEEFLNIPMI